MTSFFFYRGWSDSDKISQTGAEWHADCGDMAEMETRSRIPIWRTFARIQWPVVPEPPVTLHGAATWRIQCHDPRATCHIAGCCHRANSHDSRATCHIAGHKNSIRHIKNRFSSYFIFLVFLMQFWLWRAAAFVSSAIHLLIWWNGAENFHQSSIYTISPCSDFSCVLSQAAQ